VNKSELVKAVVGLSGTDFSKKEVEKLSNNVFLAIENALKKGDKVTLVGFGTFETIKRSSRTGRNPRSGEVISIPAKVFPKFTPGQRLRDVVNAGKSQGNG
jgi:DNA-binding protein HU-beta